MAYKEFKSGNMYSNKKDLEFYIKSKMNNRALCRKSDEHFTSGKSINVQMPM